MPTSDETLMENRPGPKGTTRIEVTEVESYGRNTSGTPLGGIATFSDGKVWKWHYSQHTKDYYFTIDSGTPSQWSCGNYGRMVAYPKRVAALKTKLEELGLAT